jgi:hypothetical protein
METMGVRRSCRGAQVASPPDQVGETPRGATFRSAKPTQIRDLKIKN